MRQTKISRRMNQSDREENKSKDLVVLVSFIDEGIAGTFCFGCLLWIHG